MSLTVRFRPTGWTAGDVLVSIVGESAGASQDEASPSLLVGLSGESAGNSADEGTITAGDGSEPVYQAGVDTLIEDEGFDSYANISAMLSGSLFTHAFNCSLVTGRNGGQAVRATWPVWSGQNSSGLNMEDVFGEGGRDHMIIQWWFKTTANVSMTGSGMKWFELWRASGPRWTCGVGQLSGSHGPTGYSQTGNEFTVHDNDWSSPNWDPFVQNVSKGGRFEDCNDGEWHRITYESRQQNGYGVRIWTDGVLRLSTFDGAPGVPEGGMDMTPSGINILKWGDVMVSAQSPNVEFSIDYDDFLIWAPN